MPFVAMAPAVTGTIASSSEYNKVVANVNQLNNTRTRYKRAEATGVSATVGALADLPGTTMTITTVEANTQVLLSAVFDVENTGGDTFLGTCVVDGVSQPSEAHQKGINRITVAQSWLVTLASVGAHTVKLQTSKAGGTSTVTVFGVHSNLTASGQGIS
jgi:hypothetical protein